MPFDKYNLGCYLLDRLAEVGVQDMFGVPGDFNLRFLDDVMAHSIKWIGSANELNAGYAADGYARCRGIGCFLTTYGVGELSAVNAVAGSYAESVPVIHIAGAPSYAQMNKRQILRHSLGDGDFLHYFRVSKELSCAAEMLTPEHACQQIDTVITEVLYHKKPGYIGLPMDVAEMECCPPTSPLVYRLPLYCEESLDAFEEAATALLQNSSSCCLLVGHLVKIMCLEEVVNRFVEAVDIPYAVTYWGKGSVNEHYQNFIGSYTPLSGQSSFGGISCSSGGGGGASTSGGTGNDRSQTSTLHCTLPDTVLHAADVLITFGVDRLDVLKYDRMLSHAEGQPRWVHVLLDGALIGNQRYTNIPMHKTIAVLQELCQTAVENYWGSYSERETDIQSQVNKDFEAIKSVADNSSNEISSLETRESIHESWKQLWETVQISLRPWDIILTDAPSDIVEFLPLRLPEGCMHITQSAYESLGYVVPAALGCQAAFPDRRVICVVGDTEIHRTFQELGTIVRKNMNIHVIVVVNSEAYSSCDAKRIEESHLSHPSGRKCLCWRNILRDISPDHGKVVATREVTKEGIVSLLADSNGEGMLFIETDLLAFRC